MAVHVRVLAVLLFMVAIAGCGGGGDDDDAAPAGTTTPRTEGHDVEFTAPPDPTTTTSSTTTTLPPPTGLPDTFPVPDNGTLQLSGSSSFSQSLELREVSAAEIHDWLVTGLEDAGYVVVEDTPTTIDFVGTNIAGRAQLNTQVDPIALSIVLGSGA